MTSYCELATAVGLTDADIEKSPDLKDPYTLVNSDYSLLTVFDLKVPTRCSLKPSFQRCWSPCESA